ncbi:PEP-CTERM sorting domain-containing protein [Aeoliella sp.]|uniref:PEP-CTERM sorting domain-containing protein n=1 Tax=Aeoliella sp. TaxID=2795800 RepID=UPI003CCBA074
MNCFRFASCLVAILTALVAGNAAQAGPVGEIDNFDTAGVSEYDFFKILDQGPTTNVSFSDAGGNLSVLSTGADGAEQVLFFRNDGVSLGVNEELQVDGPATVNGANDLGLAIGATPTDLGDGSSGDTRSSADFLFLSFRSSTQLNSRGFVGGSEVGQVQAFGVNADTLFIARLDNDNIEIGYYDGAARNVLRTETPASTDIFNNVGFYADLRGDGNTASGLDNLRIVPEPASFVLAGLAALGLVAVRRRRA